MDRSARKAESLDLNRLLVTAEDEVPTALHAAIARLHMLQTLSAEELQLNELIEMTLLRYPRGGYYERHTDTGFKDSPARDGSKASYRRLSFVLFLTPEDWVASEHGGSLRIWNESLRSHIPKDLEAYVDQEASSGTLIIFDSTLPHEVRATFRERQAIVGWFMKDL